MHHGTQGSDDTGKTHKLSTSWRMHSQENTTGDCTRTGAFGTFEFAWKQLPGAPYPPWRLLANKHHPPHAQKICGLILPATNMVSDSQRDPRAQKQVGMGEGTWPLGITSVLQ